MYGSLLACSPRESSWVCQSHPQHHLHMAIWLPFRHCLPALQSDNRCNQKLTVSSATVLFSLPLLPLTLADVFHECLGPVILDGVLFLYNKGVKDSYAPSRRLSSLLTFWLNAPDAQNATLLLLSSGAGLWGSSSTWSHCRNSVWHICSFWRCGFCR